VLETLNAENRHSCVTYLWVDGGPRTLKHRTPICPGTDQGGRLTLPGKEGKQLHFPGHGTGNRALGEAMVKPFVPVPGIRGQRLTSERGKNVCD
jgi:hypothetical protein